MGWRGSDEDDAWGLTGRGWGGGTARQHQDLLDVLTGLPCRVMISGYESVLYGDVLSDLCAGGRFLREQSNDPQAVWVRHGFYKIKHFIHISLP